MVMVVEIAYFDIVLTKVELDHESFQLRKGKAVIQRLMESAIEELFGKCHKIGINLNVVVVVVVIIYGCLLSG